MIIKGVIAAILLILLILSIIRITNNAKVGKWTDAGVWFLLETSYSLLVIGLISLIFCSNLADGVQFFVIIAIISLAISFGVIFYNKVFDITCEVHNRKKIYIEKAKNRLDQLTDIK